MSYETKEQTLQTSQHVEKSLSFDVPMNPT